MSLLSPCGWVPQRYQSGVKGLKMFWCLVHIGKLSNVHSSGSNRKIQAQARIEETKDRINTTFSSEF